MRPVLYVLAFLTVMGLAFWAYRENYATQHQLKEMAQLQDEIAGLRDALVLQRAEWAYLNRPDRLRDLATANFDRLGLLPLEPSQFGAAAEVSYPMQAEAGVTDADAGGIAPDPAAAPVAMPEEEGAADEDGVAGAVPQDPPQDMQKGPKPITSKPGDKEFP